VSLSDVVI